MARRLVPGWVGALTPASDFTARILPTYEGIAVPLEDQHICWQH